MKLDKLTIKELEANAKKKLSNEFGIRETKAIQEFLNKQMTLQEKEVFYKRINRLKENEQINVQLSMPNELHYHIHSEGELKEVGLVYKNNLQIMNPNLF